MHIVGATFTDHDDAARTIQRLSDAGITETRVIPLADVDIPYADPVLVAVRVDESLDQPVRDILLEHGGSLLADTL